MQGNLCLAQHTFLGQTVQPQPVVGQTWQTRDGETFQLPSLIGTPNASPATVQQPQVPAGAQYAPQPYRLLPPAALGNAPSLHRLASDESLLDDDGLLGDGLLDEGLVGAGAGASLDDDPLAGMGPEAGGLKNLPGSLHGSDDARLMDLPPGVDPHAELYAQNSYPSALECAKCHQKIYNEWRVSAHAYSAVSPMFQCFEEKVTQLSQGTIGTFCLRCHAPVATQMNLRRDQSIFDAPYVFREGVTCVACHRVKEAYSKSNGERRIEPGNLLAPVYGSVGGDGVAKAIADKDNYKVKVDLYDKKPGQVIHLEGIKFEQLADSSFCAPCHQVLVHPGIALEVVWAQYRAGPACKKGISCQDCHMGAVPGKAEGYAYGAAAEIDGKTVDNNRKHSNHVFWGPGNSIAHPGIFPHHEKARRWSFDQWLAFDWRSGWGTDAFEEQVAANKHAWVFPKPWDSVDERREARKIVDENLQLLALKKVSSVAVMEAGSKIDGPFFDSQVAVGRNLKFHYVVRNVSEGHNMPSGSLGAQPQLWLNVVLTGPDGRHLWESGYLDANGDLANQHSTLVAQRLVPPDLQLFNLQTQFLITGVKGTDREMYLPFNIDIDQLPFLRPGAQPVSVLNHPPFIRMEAHSIPPLDSRKAKYNVPAELISQPGRYRLSVRMRSRLEPIYFMRFCGSTPEMEQRMLEQTLDLHPYSVEFIVQ